MPPPKKKEKKRKKKEKKKKKKEKEKKKEKRKKTKKKKREEKKRQKWRKEIRIRIIFWKTIRIRLCFIIAKKKRGRVTLWTTNFLFSTVSFSFFSKIWKYAFILLYKISKMKNEISLKNHLSYPIIDFDYF